MIAEIVTIGTELLLGEIVDSNAAHIARELAAVGLDHFYTTTVGDNEVRIVAALRQALARSEVVITTGGLGPTVDDVTRQAAARTVGRELTCPRELLAQIEAFFQQRGYTMTDNNRQQAFVPEGAIPIENPVGTAPGFVIEVGDKALICLPGVPHEMRYLLAERVLPYLSSKTGASAVISTRLVHTVGIGESAVGAAISDLMCNENPTVGTRAHPGQTDVCITAKAATRDEAARLLDEMEARVRERLGGVIYGSDADTLPTVVVAGLRRRGLRLALGETNTGGLVARQLLAAEDGPQVLAGVRIALDGVSLARELGLICQAMSREQAPEVAHCLRREYDADLALAILEDMDEDSTSYMALSAQDSLLLRQEPARGDSGYTVKRTLHYALDMVRQWLMSVE